MTPKDSTTELRATFDELIAAEFPEYRSEAQHSRGETVLLVAAAVCALLVLAGVYRLLYSGLTLAL